jgi:arylsulfatase A-like enzyme
MTFNMKTLFHLTSLLLSLLAPLRAADIPSPKPNILVILADDMGFSDLGCYGSEIETPNLDKLAADGLRFTQFYNTAKCHSSRISLLTGRYPYQAGNAGLSRAITVPEVLGAAGYFTAMTGKWHLQHEPTDVGFQRYFGHLSGSCNYFTGNDTFRLNGQPWQVPQQGFYTTVANVDFALKFLAEAREAKRPWFLYVAFNAPHTPLHPLERDYKKYLGRYDAGWDVLRAARVKKQEQLGLFERKIEPSPRPDHIPAWDKLSPEQRAWESRRMAAYAGMVDRLDQEVGRLLENLRAEGELDDTCILFVSDNGADPRDLRNYGKALEPFNPATHWTRGTGAAWMSNTPFRLYKQNQFEGGIATPAIVHWPKGLKSKAGSKTEVPVHLIDVLPTLAEICGANIPADWPGRKPAPMSGVSLGPVLAGKALPTRPLYFLYNTDRGLRVGDWKLVSFQSNPWELYNLAEDRTELHNLALQQPEMRDRLAKQWFQMAKDVDMAPPKSRTPVLETAEPVTYKYWSSHSSQAAENPENFRAKKGKAGIATPEDKGK